MKRAAAELEVVVEEETTESGRVTFWSLPPALTGSAHGPSPTILSDPARIA